MPRDGSNIYHTPPGTQGIPNATIASTPYNGYLADIEQDLNLPRPIVAGGTAATNPDDALFNLHGEEAAQVITNWDSTVFEPGSFYAATTASGTAPVAGHAFAGICYLNEPLANPPTNQNVVIEARDLTDPGHLIYVRVMAAGVWGSWIIDGTTKYVLKAGDTMTGPLTISPPATGGLTISPAAGSPTVLLSGIAGTTSDVAGAKPAGLRWLARLGDATAEAGGNVGSDFSLMSFTDAGAALDTPLLFTRSTGLGVVKANPTAPLGIATKGYVDAGDANVVLYTAQSLTAPQQTQARQNIYAAPFDALAYNGMQINGSFEVSQERGQTATTSNGSYICDVWRQFFAGTMAISSRQWITAGFAGFPCFLEIDTTTAQASLGAGDYARIFQAVEGWRIARLAWGSANAQPITLGFWSAHHRTGVYSGTISNANSTRTYTFTYTQNVADAAQYNTVTIPGDTAGTWATDNTAGMTIGFALACGTTYTAPAANVWQGANYIAGPGQINAVAATSDAFRITGVVVLPGIEAPTAARAPFIMRPYDQELRTCKRYWRTFAPPGAGTPSAATAVMFMVEHSGMRATPALIVPNPITLTNAISANYTQSAAQGGISGNNPDYGLYNLGNFSGLTGGQTLLFYGVNTISRLVFDARL